jgi:hypothetical protein
MMSYKAQVAADTVKLSPAAAVVGSHIMGVNWPDVAYILTAVYTAYLLVTHITKQVLKWLAKSKQ